MIVTAEQAEREHLLRTAEAMAAAARTAPKTKGVDHLETLIVDGAEKARLADEMDAIAAESGAAFLGRDANCVRKAGAVLLLGIDRAPRGLNALCGYCGLAGCGDCAEKGAACVFGPVDLGIALGSAVSVAADRRVDTRIMFSAGAAAKRLNYLSDKADMVYGIPLSISGKSPFFDR